MTTPSTFVLIKCYTQKGKSDLARSAFERLIATVRANEQDCLGITLHQSRDHPEQLMLYERWTSRKAYEGPHMKTPHMQEFVANAMEFLAGPPEISFWEAVDS